MRLSPESLSFGGAGGSSFRTRGSSASLLTWGGASRGSFALEGTSGDLVAGFSSIIEMGSNGSRGFLGSSGPEGISAGVDPEGICSGSSIGFSSG